MTDITLGGRAAKGYFHFLLSPLHKAAVQVSVGRHMILVFLLPRFHAIIRFLGLRV
jgi:hypothetical protein